VQQNGPIGKWTLLVQSVGGSITLDGTFLRNGNNVKKGVSSENCETSRVSRIIVRALALALLYIVMLPRPQRVRKTCVFGTAQAADFDCEESAGCRLAYVGVFETEGGEEVGFSPGC
jgi:hypothetical protein